MPTDAPIYAGHRHFVPYLINRVADAINVAFLAELRKRRLTLTHWRVLAFLAEQDGLGVSALAEASGTDQSTLSRALIRMEKRQLVRRAANRNDSRGVLIYLAPRGRALFEQLLPTAMALRDAALSGLGDAQVAALAQSLQQVLENVEAHTRG